MLGLRHLPLRYRLPLIHGGLSLLGGYRSRDWARGSDDSGLIPGDLVVSGFFNESLGIGRAGCLTAEALKAAGYHAIEHDLRPCFKHIRQQDACLPGEGGVWLIHANAPETLVALLAHPPKTWVNRYRIGYWAWETPKAPRQWAFVAEFLHEIWVPSQFVRDALETTFEAAGRPQLSARLKVMPHPLPPGRALSPDRLERARQRFDLDGGLCEVLCLFDTKSSAARKNPWGVIEAWRRAFPAPIDDARLTIKVSDLSGDPATDKALQLLLHDRPDMRLMRERLSDTDMAAFVGAFDILVSLHRSEGFGLPLAEAMAAGVAVIATGWSGNLDFMPADAARLVAASRVPIRDPDGPYSAVGRGPEQVWAEPDLWIATRHLRELVASKPERQMVGKAGQQAIRALEAPWRRDALTALPFNRYL